MQIEVQIISAPWCKRCLTIKPEVVRYCQLNGASLAVMDYEELEEKEKEIVKSLPTIRMRRSTSTDWSVYTADTLETWKTDIVKLTPADTDF
jgi:thiol-disulfide isomerase/thioredoxin